MDVSIKEKKKAPRHRHPLEYLSGIDCCRSAVTPHPLRYTESMPGYMKTSEKEYANVLHEQVGGPRILGFNYVKWTPYGIKLYG